MNRILQLVPTLLMVLCVGCHDQTTAPKQVSQLSARQAISTSSKIQSFACPSAPTVTVSDEASLLAAIATASPGAVIAIQGMIGLSHNLFIATPRVTLTCAAPGAGLFALSPRASVLVVVNVGGAGVAVEGLVLDASRAPPPPRGGLLGSPYYAGDFFGVGLPVPDVRFSNNTVTCGPANCAFFDNTPGAQILNNSFTQGFASVTGVHIQFDVGAGVWGTDFADSIRVQGNVVTTTAPSTFYRFGGIRVIGYRGAIIADNVVTGPWYNSLALRFDTKSRVTGNRFEFAAFNGILLGEPNDPFGNSVQHSVFKHNLVTGAGNAGIFANQACYNILVGNDLHGNAGNVGAIFAVTTGANRFAGNGTSIVIDHGAFDCNGDGVNDPNMIVTGDGNDDENEIGDGQNDGRSNGQSDSKSVGVSGAWPRFGVRSAIIRRSRIVLQ